MRILTIATISISWGLHQLRVFFLGPSGPIEYRTDEIVSAHENMPPYIHIYPHITLLLLSS